MRKVTVTTRSGLVTSGTVLAETDRFIIVRQRRAFGFKTAYIEKHKDTIITTINK